jgi:hypothetical protein
MDMAIASSTTEQVFSMSRPPCAAKTLLYRAAKFLGNGSRAPGAKRSSKLAVALQNEVAGEHSGDFGVGQLVSPKGATPCMVRALIVGAAASSQTSLPPWGGSVEPSSCGALPLRRHGGPGPKHDGSP